MSDELDALPTQQLRDRAVRCAEEHPDVAFLATLLETIPAAEAARCEIGEADIQQGGGLIKDALHSGEGALGQALRRVFIDYPRRQPDA